MFKFSEIIFFVFILMISFLGSNTKADYNKLAYDYKFNDLDGSELSLNDFKNKVIVVVNVASQCGFTNQYEDMQKIWDKYQDKGVVMLGVPSNDFGKQEPGSNEEIKNFCEAKFGITFPMTEKVSVKGSSAHPFYIWAKENHGKSAIPKWNFHKIIIDRFGKVSKAFSSMTNPSSRKFIEVLENLIKN
jgi:glutathione peroxidase